MTIDRIVRQTLDFFAQTYAIGINQNERARTDNAAYDFLDSIEHVKRPAYIEIYNELKQRYEKGVIACNNATRTSIP